METSKNLRKLVLPNGLTVLFYRMDSVMSISAVLFVRTGAVFEKENERGISHLVEHSAFIGTQKYPDVTDISNIAENLGISYNGFTSKDSTYYTIMAPYMNFDQGLDLLSQFLFAPLQEEQQILKEKDVILSEYNDFWDNPERRFDHEVWRKRFRQKEHPYSWRPMGKPETIKKLNLKAVLNWRAKYYNPANMVLSIAGSFENKKLRDSIEMSFGQEAKGLKQKEPKFDSNDYSGFTMYLQDDKRKQITFDLSFPVFGWREVDRVERLKLRLMSVILGASRSSRLYTRLRQKEKLIYKMFCDRRLLSWMGGIVIGGSTPIERLLKTLAVTKEEIANLRKRGVTEKELDLAKNLSTAQILLQFDNPDKITRYYGEEQFYEKEVWPPKKQIAEIKKVTVSDVNSLAEKILDFSRLNVGLLGDVSSKTVEEIRKLFNS